MRGTQARAQARPPLANPQNGFVSELQRKWFVDMSSCATQAGASGDATSGLGISSLYAVFIMLAVGMALSLLWAFGELLYYKYAFHKVGRRRRRTTTDPTRCAAPGVTCGARGGGRAVGGEAGAARVECRVRGGVYVCWGSVAGQGWRWTGRSGSSCAALASFPGVRPTSFAASPTCRCTIFPRTIR
mgnify:CR=1 FL=1